MSLKLITHNIEGLGTFGTLYLDGHMLARTCEPPWQNNERNVSCIPAGEYQLVWTNSPRFGNRLALMNKNLGVRLTGGARSHILVHAGNFPEDTQGCLILGETWHPNRWGVASSKTAVTNFENLMIARPELTLTIQRN